MLLDAFRLDGRTAIVTGAGKGIGKTIATSFAEMGANVVCVARSAKDIEKTAEAARAFGGQSIAVTCDVSSENQLQNLVATTVAELGGIDIVINNAGGGGKGYGSADDVGMVRFEDTVRLNLSSAYTLIHLCLPHLRQSNSAAIVNVSSALAWMVDRNMSAYAAAKAGMNQMTRTLSHELAPDIRVNAVAPGAVDTPATEFIKENADMLRETERWIPMQRLGSPIDLALGVLFLASDASSFITGKILDIDGGMQALPGTAIYAAQQRN